MATGFEAAGLALATLPLIINQLDSYVRSAEKIRMFRRYRRTLQDYCLRIETQYVILSNHIQQLLCGTVDSQDQVFELIKNPRSDLWKDAVLKAKLEQKLGPSHQVFIGNMVRVHDIICDLCEKLNIKAPYNGPVSIALADTKADRLTLFCAQFPRFEIRPKVKFSKILFTAVYEDLLQQIGTANDILKTLIEQAARNKKEQLSVRADIVMLSTWLQESRTNARGIYDAFMQHISLECGCHGPHGIYMTVPPIKIEADKLETSQLFRVLFSRIGQTGSGTKWRWHEIEVEPKDPEPSTDITAAGYSGKDLQSRVQSTAPSSTVTTVVSAKLERPLPRTCSETPITYLCSSLSHIDGLGGQKRIGYLVGTSLETHYQMRAAMLPYEHCFNSLQQALPRTARRDRLRLAARIACAVVQFHDTWLEHGWSISEINISSSPPESKPSRDDGLLHYSKPLSPRRPETGPSDRESHYPKNLNRTLFPLGVALIELSLGESVDTLQVAEDDDADVIQAKFNTASRLLNRVYSESGSRYGDATNRCLFWPVLEGSPFERRGLEARVAETVVEPLLQDLLYFEGYQGV